MQEEANTVLANSRKYREQEMLKNLEKRRMFTTLSLQNMQNSHQMRFKKQVEADLEPVLDK